MIRVGILSFSDGRNRVHAELEAYINECAQNIKKSLTKTNEVEIILGEEIVHNSELAESKLG